MKFVTATLSAILLLLAASSSSVDAFFVPVSTLKRSTTKLSMVSEITKNTDTSLQRDNLICKDTKVIVITGASQGLGQAMAYELVSHIIMLHTSRIYETLFRSRPIHLSCMQTHFHPSSRLTHSLSLSLFHIHVFFRRQDLIKKLLSTFFLVVMLMHKQQSTRLWSWGVMQSPLQLIVPNLNNLLKCSIKSSIIMVKLMVRYYAT